MTRVTEGIARSESPSNMRQCADVCIDCFLVCNETIQFCLKQGSDHVSPRHITLLLDCAEICNTSAAFLTRHSDGHAVTCQACAEICRECTEDCRRMSDTEMKKCADTCERCAKSCEEMSSH